MKQIHVMKVNPGQNFTNGNRQKGNFLTLLLSELSRHFTHRAMIPPILHIINMTYH